MFRREVKQASATIQAESESPRPWWGHLVWAVSAGVLGFAVAAVFAGIFRLPREVYLVPYVSLTAIFMYAYLRWSHTNVMQTLRHHMWWGLLAAVFVGAFVVNNVLAQPASPPPQGLDLAFNLTWLGLIYGTIDGFLLVILPIYATMQALKAKGWTLHWSGKLAGGAFALAISLLVIGLYHVGYPELRSLETLTIMFGLGITSLAFLITGNPLTSVIPHIAMHIAAVFHGMNTVSQLPPHYAQLLTAVLHTLIG